MERNLQKNGLINLVILLVAGVVGFSVSFYTHLFTGQVSAALLGLGFLAALASWFQMRLEDQERLERLEMDELARSTGRPKLFETSDAETFPARRSREQFEKYFVPGFTVVLLLLEGAGAWWLWNWLRKATVQPLAQPLVGMAILGLLGLVLFLVGKYSAGIARLENQRLIRPGANHLLLGFYLLGFSVLSIVANWMDYPGIDLLVARALCLLWGVLAVETLLTLLLEIYRPRVKGKAERVLYESRLVDLLSQPEGIFSTVAHTLDYQFGFKVSETWFYQFLAEKFPRLLGVQAGLLLLATCFVFVDPGEQALLERFGRSVAGRELLDPGPHLKLPWPMDKVYVYTNQAVQSFYVGFVEAEEGEGHHEAAVLWTVKHYKEEFQLLVANRNQSENAAAEAERKTKAPPVSLLAVGIPVQYQISDSKKWAYRHVNAGELLERLGTREVVRYLVSVDLHEMMSSKRFTAGEELRKRIQARANELELGVKILFVGLQDCHPPVEVAGAYEEVVGAWQKREANKLAAEAYKIQTNALASAEATTRKREAESSRVRLEANAKARAALFTNQIPPFQASPSVYATRAYLQLLAREGAAARKYVLVTTNTQEIYQLNLEDKIDSALLKMPTPVNPTQKAGATKE
jgi:regulator of protease activity HflC (stomatin/prohibitin superfamily)